MNIIEEYRKFCIIKNIPFYINNKVNPYHESTLFCPAGMQQYKNLFKDQSYYGTKANIQSCIRMNDFEEIGDSSHLLYFNMIGLFSFREMQIQDAINFWLEFLLRLNIKPDYVTIHPDKIDWKKLYQGIEVRISEECIWTDGEIGGYSTEFFINEIEIGNIVNPLGNCIDVGFGLERLEMFVNGKIISKEETLKETVLKIIDSGYKPSNLKQGYVLRKLLRELYKNGWHIEHEYFYNELERQNKIRAKYERLKDKYIDKPKEWWFDTHGINLNEIQQ